MAATWSRLATTISRKDEIRSGEAPLRRRAFSSCEELREGRSHGFGLPRFIEREFDRYLRCRILAHGFARVRCDGCAAEIVVAFSCKGRGVCPSCTARRMADTAASLCDHVLPVAR